jgi:hypothetical protein
MEETVEGALEYWMLHGSHEPIRGENPAAGAPFAYTIPGTVEQELLAVSFTYTASAAAATRRPVIRFLDYGGRPFAEIGTPFTITATNVSRVTFGLYVNQFGANNSARMGAAIPPLRLGDGLSFEVTADAIAAADTITAVAFFVRKWPVRL